MVATYNFGSVYMGQLTRFWYSGNKLGGTRAKYCQILHEQLLRSRFSNMF